MHLMDSSQDLAGVSENGPRKRSKTCAEKQSETARKRSKKQEAQDEARKEGWRNVNTKNECWLHETYPTSDAFPLFTIRKGVCRSADMLFIFLTFVTAALIQTMIDAFRVQDTRLGFRKKCGTFGTFNPTVKMVLLLPFKF